MPPRKRSTTALAPLTDDDVADLRTKVNAGERPRVVVRAASAAVPSGTRGNVIRLGDPREGEFVVVRLGRDEVPFAPVELALPGRAGKAAGTPKATRTATKASVRSGRAARTTSPTRAATAKAAPAKAAAAKTTPAVRAPSSGTRATSATAEAAAGSGRQAGRSRGKGGAKSSRRSAPPLSVTLRFTDGAWTVEAQRGARRLSRPAPLRPGAVKAFADHVDQPEVREALTETVESCRAVVAERAEKLRAELAAAEASLKEYEARRR